MVQFTLHNVRRTMWAVGFAVGALCVRRDWRQSSKRIEYRELFRGRSFRAAIWNSTGSSSNHRK